MFSNKIIFHSQLNELFAKIHRQRHSWHLHKCTKYSPKTVHQWLLSQGRCISYPSTMLPSSGCTVWCVKCILQCSWLSPNTLSPTARMTLVDGGAAQQDCLVVEQPNQTAWTAWWKVSSVGYKGNKTWMKLFQYAWYISHFGHLGRLVLDLLCSRQNLVFTFNMAA